MNFKFNKFALVASLVVGFSAKAIPTPEAVEPAPLPTAEQYVQPTSPIAACTPPMSMLMEKMAIRQNSGRMYNPRPLKNPESRAPTFLFE